MSLSLPLKQKSFCDGLGSIRIPIVLLERDQNLRIRPQVLAAHKLEGMAYIAERRPQMTQGHFLSFAILHPALVKRSVRSALYIQLHGGNEGTVLQVVGLRHTVCGYALGPRERGDRKPLLRAVIGRDNWPLAGEYLHERLAAFGILKSGNRDSLFSAADKQNDRKKDEDDLFHGGKCTRTVAHTRVRASGC